MSDRFGSTAIQNGTLNLTASYAGGATNTFLYTFQADPPTVSPPSQVITQAVTMSAGQWAHRRFHHQLLRGRCGG